MSAIDALGATSSIITILETSIKVFEAIATVATNLIQYSERTTSIIRQCNFDAETIRTIITIVHDNPSLLANDKDRKNTEDALYDLQISLFKVKARLEPFKDGTLSRRLLWSVAIEKVAVEVEKDLFQWSQRLFMRLTTLLSRFRTSVSYQQISPLLKVPELKSQYRMGEIVAKAKAVDVSSLKREIDDVTLIGAPASRMMGTVGDQTVLVEFRPYEASADDRSREAAEQDAHQLAAILNNTRPSLMNILQCQGYYHDVIHSRFGLLFSVPTSVSTPNDFIFLDKLIATHKRYSLTKRFDIARRVAAAVFITHGVQWVHKKIQSRNVMICLHSSTSSSEAYLTGFENSRDKHGISDGTESDIWQDKLYRHSDRQATQGNAFYVPAYDIYSLGVVLLEIARWKTFASEKDKNGEFVFEKIDAQRCKRRLVERYLPGISHHVGETYARVVHDCLHVDRSNGMDVMGDVLARLEHLAEMC